MNKWFFGMILLICVLALAGCSSEPSKDETVAQAQEQTVAASEVAAMPFRDLFEIREKMFIAEVNDIYLNVDDYIDKTICYEGLFDFYPYEDGGGNQSMFYSVIRYGPGCCGNDGNVGFEVIWDKPYPKQNDWVRVEGTLEQYEEFGETYIRLRASALDVLPTRGNEIVAQ